MRVKACQNRVTSGYNRLAAMAGGTVFIHILPLLFELPSYVRFMENVICYILLFSNYNVTKNTPGIC
jgi:hypothetical protein